MCCKPGWTVIHHILTLRKKEKEDLAITSGLTVSQIQAWFARTRQRKLRPQKDDNLQPIDLRGESQTRQITKSHLSSQHNRSSRQSRVGSSARLSFEPGLSSLQVVPASPQRYHTDEQPESDISGLHFHDFENSHGHTEPSGLSCGTSMVHWWLDTLPEEIADYDYDPAFEDELYPGLTRLTSPGSALSCSSDQSHFEELLRALRSRQIEDEFTALLAPRARESMSVLSSSLGTNLLSSQQSSCGTGHVSASSAKTFATSSTSYSFSRRRGRRMPTEPRVPSPGEPQKRQRSREKKYYCTFCAKGFRDRYRWRRQEESMHAPQKSWICKSVQPSQDQPPVCPLCHFFEGRPAQCLHDMQPCWSKPEKDRTFYRKDNLVQHLEGVHNARAGISSALLDELTEGISVVPYDLTCHFCKHQSPTWQSRANHVASHFESGMTMASWKWPEAINGMSVILDQIKPYAPQLSRLWATDDPQKLIDFQQKLQLRSPSPICRSRQPHLPRIVIEDYSAADKSRVAQESSRSVMDFSLDGSRIMGQINSTMHSEKDHMHLTLNKADVDFLNLKDQRWSETSSSNLSLSKIY